MRCGKMADVLEIRTSQMVDVFSENHNQKEQMQQKKKFVLLFYFVRIIFNYFASKAIGSQVRTVLFKHTLASR